jgi:glycosyltransferase involved in cell wall biosynthesis/SAM-dependent methyltransferase
MKKVAIIVQRCHESVVGGSEALAWQYASLLKDDYEVDVLSTTATDAAYWTNVLPEGLEVRDGINVRRFHVDIGYSPYRTELFTRMLRDYERFGVGKGRAADVGTKHLTWSIALQEEFIRRIGPYSERLIKFVEQHSSDYRALIVVTYLYPTAYFSLLEIPRGRALFAPTLHDEQPAYFSVYQHAAHRAHSLIWLTEAERKLGCELWGELPGRVVAMPIDARPRPVVTRAEPYLLYCGRIDPNKGCDDLFDYFIRFKENHPSPLRLVLTGKDDIPIPDHPEIDFLGFVGAEEKFGLMAGATVYIMPSGKESFSIVTLEAMAQRTPVLVNGASEVLADHVRQSGGGSIYQDSESFVAELSEMLADKGLRSKMGEAGREYVISRYTPERIRAALIEAVESCPEAGVNGKVVAAQSSSSTADSPSLAEGKKADEARQICLSNSPPLPLPPGWSEEELRELVVSVRVEDAPIEELRIYASSDFRRFVYTLGLVPERPGLKLLELGANPYFTTTLLHKFRKATLHLANFFNARGEDASQQVKIHKTGEVIRYHYKQFNIEEDIFPYPDDFFDVVLFCEIIEHLLSDPVHALNEIRRVLKPGGSLVLTTPNVVRLDNVRKIIAGENVYDPYSGYGPYGRHNREYTPQDLFGLLSANGFLVNTLFTADVNPGHTSSPVKLEIIAPLVKDRQADLGQYIFCQSSVTQASKRQPPVRPDWLYRSMHKSKDEGGEQQGGRMRDEG